ncbi:MAG: SDR family NAD(P)-dependent oxidoreductase [Candidatus Thermoplasmatota archaeon]|nr:SDR family NAD(P)-dependent oxidoreductase [Candidatus Thermoplasmatota archaeon]
MKRIRSFKGTRSLVTGGSSGIGLEISRLLANEGSEVIMVARDPNRLRTASRSVKGCKTFSSDVSEKESLDEVASKVFEEGALDLLVNCAGISIPGEITDLEQRAIEDTLDINLLGTINSCRSFLSGMGEGSHVINFSSVAGIVGIYGYTAYSASKFGVIGFSQALRMELKEKGIGVSVVLPPDTDTPQLHGEDQMKPKRTRRISGSIPVARPEWVAKRTLDSARSRRFMVVLTIRGKLLYRASCCFPEATRWYIDRL